MGNVKESTGGTEFKPSNQPESQESIISERVGQPQCLEETAENDHVNIGTELMNYGRQNFRRYKMTTMIRAFQVAGPVDPGPGVVAGPHRPRKVNYELLFGHEREIPRKGELTSQKNNQLNERNDSARVVKVMTIKKLAMAYTAEGGIGGGGSG